MCIIVPRKCLRGYRYFQYKTSIPIVNVLIGVLQYPVVNYILSNIEHSFVIQKLKLIGLTFFRLAQNSLHDFQNMVYELIEAVFNKCHKIKIVQRTGKKAFHESMGICINWDNCQRCERNESFNPLCHRFSF